MKIQNACLRGIWVTILVAILNNRHALAADENSRFSYPGYVITSIDVEPLGKGHPTSRVKFHARIPGKVDDTTAHVLRDVVDSGETVGKWPFRSPVFHGTVVPPGQLQARLDAESPRVSDRWNPLQHRKALLCVHGFDSQPESWLRRCAENYGKSDELAIIPVIWPAGDKGLRDYMNDRNVFVPGAARAFQPLLDVASSLRKSLLCHSMGNFVLKLTAPPHQPSRTSGLAKRKLSAPPFEDVYMSAADVRHDVFDRAQNDHDDANLDYGRNIAGMAQNKVHVMHSRSDVPLMARRARHAGLRALGSNGANMKNLHPSLKGKVVNVDCYSWNKWTRKNNLYHSYFFKSEAIKYYEQRDA
jgi:esterase/lipase superfamily enzyme